MDAELSVMKLLKGDDAELVSGVDTILPDFYQPYTDKYFLRSKEILEKEDLNPYVTVQVFCRGEGVLAGIDTAIRVIEKYACLKKRDAGHLYYLPNGSKFENCLPIMLIQARVQDIIELETMYLGVIAQATSLANGIPIVNLDEIAEKVMAIRELVGDRKIAYFGARHWDFMADAYISYATKLAGADCCSTDFGSFIGFKDPGGGVGTIPHSLENIYAWKYGMDRAVVESTVAFDNYIDKDVPRIALVDFNNKEIDDTLAVAREFKNKGAPLYGVRIDTCGENIMQGANTTKTGVTIEGVRAVREALDNEGFNEVKIILTSGFANPKKVEEFVNYEKEHNIRLFDELGVGGLFPHISVTADIIEVGDDLDNMNAVSKVGRGAVTNSKLIKLY